MPRLRRKSSVEGNGRVSITGPRRPLAGRLKALEGLLASIVPIPEEWRTEAAAKNGDEFITRRLSDVEPVAVTWVWLNRIPLGKLSILQGDPGQGKTWLVLDIISHVTKGTAFCDGAQCQQGESLFVTAEDGVADTIRPRFESLNGDASKVHWLDVVRAGERDVSFDLDRHLGLLDSWLLLHPQVCVVALDPLAAFLGKIDSHRNSDVRGVLGRLAKLAEKHSVAVIAVNHLTKGLAKAIHRSIGSIAFVAAARAVWQVSADRDDPGRRLFLPVKMNLARTGGLAFRLTDNGIVWEEGSVEISADDAEADDGDTPRGEAKDWLRDILKDGPVPSKEIERRAKEDGICMRTLKYAKKELGVKSKRSNGVWSWHGKSKIAAAFAKALSGTGKEVRP